MAYTITISVNLKDTGVDVITGNQPMNSFMVDPDDLETAINFAKGDKIRHLIWYMSQIADGTIPKPQNVPVTVLIKDL